MIAASIRIRFASRYRIPSSSYFWQPRYLAPNFPQRCFDDLGRTVVPVVGRTQHAASYTSSSMRTASDDRALEELMPERRPPAALSPPHRQAARPPPDFGVLFRHAYQSCFVIVICVHEGRASVSRHTQHPTSSSATRDQPRPVNSRAPRADTRHYAPTRAPRRGGP